LPKIHLWILYWYPGLALTCTRQLARSLMYHNGNVCSHVQ